jgi:hypothetical protein
VLQSDHDLGQLATCFGRLVDGLGADVQHPGALEASQPLQEQAARRAGGTVGDLVERPASQDDDVAQDDDRPALGEEL